MVVKRVISLTLLLIIFPMLFIEVRAQEVTYIPDEYDDFMDSIPDDISDLLPEGVFSKDFAEFGQAVAKISSFEYIFDAVFDAIGLNIKNIIKTFAKICSLLMLCSLINMLKNSFHNEKMEQIFTMMGSSVVLISIIELSRAPISRVMLLFDEIKIFVNSLTPLICTMYAMGGNVNNAIVHNYGLIVFLSIVENLCVLALRLIVFVCMAMALASAFMPNTNLTPMTDAIKKTFTFSIGFIMFLFTTIISSQTLLAAKADTFTSKTAKMLLSQAIPLVGGGVGDSLRTAGASIEYLRSNVGIAIIIILFLMLLPTLISVFLYRIVFNFSVGIAGLLGCDKEGKMISEISSIYGYVLAILSICSIVLVILMALFSKCVSPLS